MPWRWPFVRDRKGLGDMPFADQSHWTPVGGGQTRIILPGSRRNWAREAGEIWRNSAAAIGINWIAQSFPEAPLVVAADTSDGKTLFDREHPLAKLWRRPNPLYSGRAMTSVAILSLLCKGDAYLLRIPGRTPEPVQLWWIPHWLVRPTAVGYDVRQANGETITYRPDQMVHLRYGIDPHNPMEGYGPLTMALRECVTDNEAATYVVALLTSAGIGGVIMTDRDPHLSVDEDEAARLKAKLTTEQTGDKRFNVVYIPATVNVEHVGFSPNDMAVDDLTQQAVARIFATIGLSPMACGLPDPQKTYSNAAEAKRGGWENGVLPLMALICDELDFGLLPAFAPKPNERTAFDTREVKALQDDRNLRDDNARKNYVAGIWKRSEAREETGRPWVPEDEVYMTDIVDARAVRAAEAQATAQASLQPAPGDPTKGISRRIAKAESPTPWADRVLRELASLAAQTAEPSE
jgi:HK97 family phage portal protein